LPSGRAAFSRFSWYDRGMNRSTKTLSWILAALLLFALGYVCFGIYQAARTKQIQEQPAPSAPVVPANNA